MIFNKTQVKNIPRAKQMNINVATWGRLLKRSTPSIQSQPKTIDGAGHSMAASGNSTLPADTTASNAFFEVAAENLEPAFTVGEDPDMNVVGLSGARPLGK